MKRKVFSTDYNKREADFVAGVREGVLSGGMDEYLRMSDEEFDGLPLFNEDGGVVLYEVGGVLMGKLMLKKVLQDCKKNKIIKNVSNLK